MRLVDLGLQAITAPNTSSAGVAALAAVAGLAVLGAAKRFRDPFKNLPVFDFGDRSAYDTATASQEQYVREMGERGLPVKTPLLGNACRVWADWAVEQGHLAGEWWTTSDANVPHVHVRRETRPSADLVECSCSNTKPVPPEDAPKVIRGLLDRLGYDGEAIVPLEGWRVSEWSGGRRQKCPTPPGGGSLFIDYNLPQPLWKTEPGEDPAPLSEPYNYVLVASYGKLLPRKKTKKP